MAAATSYEKLDRMGAGAFGAVYRAWDVGERRYVAVKELHPAHTESPERVHRFFQEQLLELDHPNVLAPFDWGSSAAGQFLVTELCAGGSLEDLLSERGPLPPAVACALTIQVLDGLSHIHACGIVHRDVKPGNVLLLPGGAGTFRALVGDFGYALMADGPRMSVVPTVAGTTNYVAPEVCALQEATPRSDLWSVGVMLVEMLCGHRSASSLKQVPPDFRHVVMSLCAGEPEERFASAAEAAAAVRQLARAIGPIPEDFEVPSRLPPPPKRRRTLRLRLTVRFGGATLLIAAMIVGAWWASGDPVYRVLWISGQTIFVLWLVFESLRPNSRVREAVRRRPRRRGS